MSPVLVPDSSKPKLADLDADRLDSRFWQGAYPRDPNTMRPMAQGRAMELLGRARVGHWIRVACEFEGACDFPLTDSPLTPEMWGLAQSAASAAIQALRAGRRVLVTCNAGMNRSGLVCGLVLVRHFGLSGGEAVRRIQLARGPVALSNKSFAEEVRRASGLLYPPPHVGGRRP